MGALLLNVLCEVALANRDRIEMIFDAVVQHLTSVIEQAQPYPLLLDRALVSLLRLGIRLIYKEQLAGRILHALTCLVRLPKPLLPQIQLQIIAGICDFITLGNNVVTVLQREKGWELILNILLLAKPQAEAMQFAVRALNVLLASTDLTPELYVPAKRAAVLFAECWCSGAVVSVARSTAHPQLPQLAAADAQALSPGSPGSPPAVRPVAPARSPQPDVSTQPPLPLACLDLLHLFHKRTLQTFTEAYVFFCCCCCGVAKKKKKRNREPGR